MSNQHEVLSSEGLEGVFATATDANGYAAELRGNGAINVRVVPQGQTVTTQPLITIDTDNAVVRIYLDAARSAGLTPDGLVRLRLDADAVSMALSSVSGAQFRVIHA